MTFDFNEHKHRYAIWTAARAVQRSFAKTIHIKEVINFTSLKKFSEADTVITQDEFDVQQKEWCNLIMQYFNKGGENETCSMGALLKLLLYI